MRPPVSRTIDGLLREQAALRPDADAVVAGDTRLTYRELADLAAAAAGRLRELGVRDGDRVGLLADNRAEWLAACFGAVSLGATLAAFNTWVKPRELDHLLAHSGVRVLVTVDRFGGNDYLAQLRELVPEPWGDIHSPRYPALRAIEGAARLVSGVWCSDTKRHSRGEALLLYTSGSTARPKAVPLEHGRLVENGFAIGERMGLGPADRVWLGSPLFWSFGSANALMATMTHGATLVLQSPFEPTAAVALMERERCTAAYLLPTMTHALLPHAPRGLGTVRTGVTIGSPEEVRLAAETLGITGICNVYGSTETYGNCAVTPHDAPLADRLDGQGPPLPGVRLRVVDPVTRAELPAGATGELEVAGSITPGYLDGTPADDAAFTTDGHYRTGDLGWIDEQGWLHFVARISELIKTNGINVSPAEVEQYLLAHPAVAEVAVVGVPDETAGELVVAFVVTKTLTTADELRAYCRAGMATFKAPARIELVDELPRTDTGKLSRRDLRARAHGA